MLYLFSGDDAKNKLAGYEKFIKTVPKSTEIFAVSRNNFDRTQIESLYSGSSLFSATSAVVFSGVLDYEETREFALSKLKQMGESENHFIFLESKLNKPILDTFKKARAEINIFELPKAKKEKYDNFLVANAFANKDKLNTWIYFRQAMDAGVVMEEIIGVLFWKIKDVLLKKNFAKFSEKELKNFISRISYLLPEARKQGRDAESAFEQFLLEAF
jgi:hypothetical protein